MNQERILKEIGLRNNRCFDQKVGKLHRRIDDRKLALEQETKDLDQQIRETKRASAAAPTLADKPAHQRTKTLQATRNQKRKHIFGPRTRQKRAPTV